MFVSVGYSGFVSVFKISAISDTDSAPLKKLRREAKRKGLLLDFTKGHPAKTILFLSDDKVVLSSLLPETVVSRANKMFIKLGIFNREIPIYDGNFNLRK